jgi:LacI family transcriptional regulator
MRNLLNGESPDGVFCYNDPMAIAAIDVVLQAGLRIPRDIAFIGCDNLHFDGSLKAPLSSMDHRSSDIGVRAAKLLLRLLKDESAKTIRRVVLKPSLVVRESSQRMPSANGRSR